jgi:tellurite resistance protein
MARATTVLAATSIACFAATIWLYVDNRSLRAELDARSHEPPPKQEVAARAPDPIVDVMRSGPSRASWKMPVLATPAPNPEAKLDKRARRQAQMTSLLGRADGETEDQWKARIMPLVQAGLAIPRKRVEAMRKLAEEKANVTEAQSRQLDAAFQKTYQDALDYSNKAIADGTLSPYERNIANWLEFGGGLGTILQDANGQIGHVLSPDQLKTMYDSGFEWGEYLGLEAPWEKLTPPPPPHH